MYHFGLYNLSMMFRTFFAFYLYILRKRSSACSNQYTCFTLWREKKGWGQTGGRQGTQIEEGVEVCVLILFQVSI